MRLIGYIKAFKENSFTIPIYSDGVSFYNHYLDEFYTIIDFIKVEVDNDSNLNKVYLSTVFEKGSVGACVFVGRENYIFFNQAGKIIDEIIAYLDDTTTPLQFINIKREVSILQKILIKDDLRLNTISVRGETITFDLQNTNANNSLNTFDLAENNPIIFSLEEYGEFKNDNLNVKPSNPFKETIIKKYMERVLLDKSLHHTNKEVIFLLFQNFLNENRNELEEILLNTKVGSDFSSYLSNTNDITISPIELTIEETLRFRAEERRRKLKDFNYQFIYRNRNCDEIKEMENVPAYKRFGIDLTDLSPSDLNISKVAIWEETKKVEDKNSTKTSEVTKTITNT